MASDKQRLSDKIDTAFTALKKEMMYFYDKDPEYAGKMADWFYEVGVKNKLIHLFRNNANKSDKEMVRRRRSRVYYIDFGVNVGSEFNYPHFCVVVSEFKYHSVVVPLSTVKETDTDGWKKDEDNLFIEIGEVENFPLEQKDCYAVVSKIREVSKQRLSDYKHPVTKKFIELKLTDEQMDKVDAAITKLCTK
ncbi:type II toxin-antitoxin system PemK/MazF family toxin [Metabacillus litoralis]|uniref:type II toxin-antitoxin system PemK/MazF family toxin n=1 Tax=Metabacillus litoralis TaxID=152268 RepID=UPI00203F23EE|nr:type II toxin-antitoxin system PemK/MazF family toxin [Metabacillus litoralis]MCM3165101.1 type II toxin-antitoxin system PemK/MazF family toxin [Metabacillus litoralis]